jgi:hypothetical protein
MELSFKIKHQRAKSPCLLCHDEYVLGIKTPNSRIGHKPKHK